MGALTHDGEVLQSLPTNASQINFDKTGTDLNSTQVENAIKEVNAKVNTNADDITQLKSGLMSNPTAATKNSDYVGDNFLKVLRIGNLVNVSGRFQVTTEKPAGQGNYLFSGLPVPYGGVVAVNSTLDKEFIVTAYGVLTSNIVVPTGNYNVQVTYSVTN